MDLEILTCAESGACDRAAAERGVPLGRLMEVAGAAVAETCLGFLAGAAPSRILVLCGPGNNGGDGFVAARLLSEAGHRVTVASAFEADRAGPEAVSAAGRYAGPRSSLTGADPRSADLVVDALFGAGLSRPIEGAAALLIERVNASGCPVVAVDVPSGINGDTGQVMGTAMRAGSTVTFFRRKPGHLLLPGRVHCGTLHVVDIGIPESVLAEVAPRTFLNAPALWRGAYRPPSVEGHKYSRGHALVVSGPMPTIGAARLSARGAARVGAGLVTVASPPDAIGAHAAQLTSIMLRPFSGAAGLADILADSRKNAVILGPGLGSGPETRPLVETALRPAENGARRAVVLDADALTSFADAAGGLARLIAGAKGSVVATPHDGEFAKLFGRGEAAFTDPSKLVRARAGAEALGAVLVLKGADTVVVSPDGRAAIACSDAPWLATAGSGDVLSGLVGGLLAQGMDGFEAAAMAVWLHAEAARKFGPGLVSDDLPDMLPAVLRDVLSR